MDKPERRERRKSSGAHRVDSPKEKQEMVAPSTPAHRVCRYHAPTEMQQIRYGKIRTATQELVETIVDMCPPSADRSAAIRKVREAAMAANASIAVPQDDVNLLNREPQVPDELLVDYKTLNGGEEERPF